MKQSYYYLLHSLTRNILTNTATTCRRSFSLDKIAEDKIRAWLQQGGAENLKGRGQPYKPDRHKDAATALGVGLDYTTSKILANNNIKPKSVQRRLAMDAAWKQLQLEIQQEYSKSNMNVDDFVQSPDTKKAFLQRMNELNQMAKACNNAIIDDSMFFNGRSPVRHARPYIWEERIREALEVLSNNNYTNKSNNNKKAIK